MALLGCRSTIQLFRKSWALSSTPLSALMAGLRGTAFESFAGSSFGGFEPPSDANSSRHQPSNPCQRPSCVSRLLPARTSEFDADRWPLKRALGKVDER